MFSYCPPKPAESLLSWQPEIAKRQILRYKDIYIKIYLLYIKYIFAQQPLNYRIKAFISIYLSAELQERFFDKNQTL